MQSIPSERNQVHELSGINPDEQPLGPPTECIFDTDETAGPAPVG